MHPISPAHYKLTKRVNASLEISLTYHPVPGHPDKFDCTLEFVNLHEKDALNEQESEAKGPNSNDSALLDTQNPRENSRGWFGSFWATENPDSVRRRAPEVSLYLGYIQMLGYARLNHQIGADSGSDSSLAVYWKNQEYTATYCSAEADEKVQQILQTELFKDRLESNKEDANGSEPATTWKLGGVPDLHATTFDATAHYLLHDLVHPFNTMDLPNYSSNLSAQHLTAHQQEELSQSLSKFIAPFYVTAQHLVFLSERLLASEKRTYTFRLNMPPQLLPPSYNTKLTGSVGEAGLASIVYLVVVGVQEENGGVMRHRAVYFPMEFRPGQYGPDRSWFQHDFLRAPLLDKTWSPQSLSEEESSENNDASSKKEVVLNTDKGTEKTGKKTGNGENRHNDETVQSAHSKKESSSDHNNESAQSDASSARHRFLEELDSLIEGSLESVAAKERRKSSVSYVSPGDHGLLLQMPEKPRVAYQIRVNNLSLCGLTLSSATYHVGDDIHFFLQLHPDFRTSSRVIGLTCYVEAHEIFHVPENHQVMNIYKVTPTIKANTYADALMFPFNTDQQKKSSRLGAFVNLPRFLTQQFQASSFMDLRYFMVFRFVLNDFPEMESYRIDQDTKAFAEYVLAYKVENEANEFKFCIPLTVLP